MGQEIKNDLSKLWNECKKIEKYPNYNEISPEIINLNIRLAETAGMVSTDKACLNNLAYQESKTNPLKANGPGDDNAGNTDYDIDNSVYTDYDLNNDQDLNTVRYLESFYLGIDKLKPDDPAYDSIQESKPPDPDLDSDDPDDEDYFSCSSEADDLASREDETDDPASLEEEFTTVKNEPYPHNSNNYHYVPITHNIISLHKDNNIPELGCWRENLAGDNRDGKANKGDRDKQSSFRISGQTIRADDDGTMGTIQSRPAKHTDQVIVECGNITLDYGLKLKPREGSPEYSQSGVNIQLQLEKTPDKSGDSRDAGNHIDQIGCSDHINCYGKMVVKEFINKNKSAAPNLQSGETLH